LKGNAKNIQRSKPNICGLKKSLIEMKEHLGFEKWENKEGGRNNYRNGSYSKIYS
jgi:transposase-like protein